MNPPGTFKTACSRLDGSHARHHQTESPGGDLAKALIDYYTKQGIWEERGWVGGCEMGIAFPPDWVGNFVFEPLDTGNHHRVFERGTVIIHENQFYLPREEGHLFQIECLMFKDDHAKLMSSIPYGLHVIE